MMRGEDDFYLSGQSADASTRPHLEDFMRSRDPSSGPSYTAILVLRCMQRQLSIMPRQSDDGERSCHLC